MNKILFTIVFTFITTSLSAEIVHFRAPALKGKLVSDLIELTDWQAVMTCHYNLNGRAQEVMKYPATYLKHTDTNSYSVEIKSMSLFEALPHLELQSCSYKMILIGKNKSTHQTAFGEIYLAGTDHGTMTEKELDNIQNKDLLAKILTERTREINITYGTDGGIVLVKSGEE